MKSYRDKTGFTLVEILVVVAIIAILTLMVITLAARFETQGKERGMKSALALLDAALGEFRDYGFSYRHPDYNDLEFPLDCNGFSKTDLEATLRDALGAVSVSIIGDHNDPNFSGSEALYFFLSKVPDSRKTLEKIDSSLITSKDKNKQDMTITIDVVKEYPLFRIIDPWGRTLRYDYYDENPPPLIPSQIKDMQDSKKVFPVITSAGQDGVFGTDDDITNRN